MARGKGPRAASCLDPNYPRVCFLFYPPSLTAGRCQNTLSTPPQRRCQRPATAPPRPARTPHPRGTPPTGHCTFCVLRTRKSTYNVAVHVSKSVFKTKWEGGFGWLAGWLATWNKFWKRTVRVRTPKTGWIFWTRGRGCSGETPGYRTR